MGGECGYSNLQLLHRHCHDTKTSSDGSLGRTHEKGQVIEEPDEAKCGSFIWNMTPSCGDDSPYAALVSNET